MNLDGLKIKDITKEFIKEHFDIDAERKYKKVKYDEFCYISDITHFEKPLLEFTKILDKAKKQAIAKGYDVSDIKLSIVPHDGEPLYCSSYAEFSIFVANAYRKETDKEVIERLRRRIKKQIRDSIK